MENPSNSSPSWPVAPAWRIDRPFPIEQLTQNQHCHTAVIGGGITGLSAALSIARSGKDVIVLNAGQLAEGSTGWCGGILSLDTTIEFSLIESMFGEERTKSLATQLESTLLSYKQLLGKDCDWQSGDSICFAAKARHKKSFIEEVETRNRFGFNSDYLSQENVPSAWVNFSSAFRMQREHSVHPVKLVMAMAAQIRGNGGNVFEQSKVDSWQYLQGRFVIRVGEHEVTSENLILCQGVAIADSQELRKFRRLLVPALGHVLVTKPCPEARQILEQGVINFWDSLQLYHYGRYLPDGRILIGGEDIPGFQQGTSLESSDVHIARLYDWAQKHHSFTIPPIEYAWKAGLSIPFDGMPVLSSRNLGQNNKLVTAVTDGLPSAFLLGQAICDVLDGSTSEFHALFSNERPLSLAGKLLSKAEHPLASKFAHRIAFSALALWDALT